MIGLDFPVKPRWIHDVHQLWQPEQSVSGLVRAALGQTMQELGGEKTRRNSLTIILRYFVATEGGGQSRRTAAQDVWVAYARRSPRCGWPNWWRSSTPTRSCTSSSACAPATCATWRPFSVPGRRAGEWARKAARACRRRWRSRRYGPL